MAFKELYNHYVKFFLLTAMRYVKTKEDAEDLVQEAFVKIFKDLKQFDSAKGPLLLGLKEFSSTRVCNI